MGISKTKGIICKNKQLTLKELFHDMLIMDGILLRSCFLRTKTDLSIINLLSGYFRNYSWCKLLNAAPIFGTHSITRHYKFIIFKSDIGWADTLEKFGF